MKSFAKCGSAVAALVLLAGTVVAADAITTGQVKTVDSDRKEVVLTDAAGKDGTYKLGDRVLINRDGKESQNDLKAGDKVSLCYDRGLLTWTAHYFLVQDGASKNCSLVQGTFKDYDAAKKEFTVTDENRKDCTYAMGDAKVRLNRQDSKVQDMKIGDRVLAIIETVGDKGTLKCLMIERSK